MLGAAFGIGVLLALAGGAAAHSCGERQPSRGSTGEKPVTLRGAARRGRGGPPLR